MPTALWGVCPSVQAHEGICKSSGSRVHICPSQSYRTLIYFSDSHGWNSKTSLCCMSAGLVEEWEKHRWVQSWWGYALLQLAPLPKERGVKEALWKSAFHSCLSEQLLCIYSFSHTARFNVRTLHVMWVKSTIVHLQDTTPWSHISLGHEPSASPGKSIHAGVSP